MGSDYRSEKADSIEGKGNARVRWFGYLATLPKDVLSATGWLDGGDAGFFRRNASPAQVRELENQAKDESELVGFWVLWHIAGGFEQLEDAGWNRATIFRKIKRFRDRYGAHPDEYKFSWLTIDFDKVWHESLIENLHG